MEKNNPEKAKQQKWDQVPGGRLTKKTKDKILKKAFTAMQISFTNKYDNEESDIEDQLVIAKEDSDSEPEDLLALMVNLDSDIDDDEELRKVFRTLRTTFILVLISLSSVLIDAYQKLSTEKQQLVDKYASLRYENKYVEVSKENMKIFIADIKV